MDIRRLDLNLLLLLDELLRTGNLSAVARKLSMSQPSASAGLSKLRYFFRDELFVRTGRGLRPTPFAQTLAQPVREVIEKVTQEILVKPAFDPQENDRVFTLAMADIGEIIFLPPLLHALHACAPRARLRCVPPPYTQLYSALEEGTIDLAIGYFPDLVEPGVVSQRLIDHGFACIVRRDHPKVGARITLEQFLELDQLVIAHESRSLELFEDRVRELGLRRRILLQVPHFMSVPRLIAGTDMISVVPLSLATWFAQTFGLKVVEPPIKMPLIPLKQFWHRRMHKDPAVAWLRTIVARQLMDRDPGQAMSPQYGTQYFDAPADAARSIATRNQIHRAPKPTPRAKTPIAP